MNENFIINLEGNIPAIKARYPRLSTNVIRSIAANFQYSGNLVANIAGFRRALKSHNNLARSGIIERVRFSTANLNNALPKPKYKRPTKFKPVQKKTKKKTKKISPGNLAALFNLVTIVKRKSPKNNNKNTFGFGKLKIKV
jgi:hypothetical protein